MISISYAKAQVAPFEGKPADFRKGNLKVSDNKRFLVFADGTPFFYLGDTAWELFHRLNFTEAESYLEDRRQKGFTVIQAVALAELDGLNTPNRNGDRPLINNDPTQPNEAYFCFVDSVIRLAETKGLFIALLPTWGDKLELMPWGGIEPVVFNETNAKTYGNFIGKRYKDYKNIIWVIGGDRFGADEGGDFGGPRTNNFPIWNAIARAIKSVDNNHLMTFHPIGWNSSSRWFHNAEWLDFNMAQTGHHDRSYSCFRDYIVNDYNKTPIKPTFDGEPRYEDHPIRWQPDSLGWFNEMHVRQAAYWSLFSGAFGHTYGTNSVWQFYSPGRTPLGFARHNWYDVLDLPGAQQMQHVRNLMESRPFLSRIPVNNLVLNPGDDYSYIIATKGDGYVMVYSPLGYEIELSALHFDAKEYKVWWFDPRCGKSRYDGVITIEGREPFRFSPPSRGPGFDWVLVLDEVGRNFPAPGVPIF